MMNWEERGEIDRRLFEIFFHNFPGRTEENHKKCQSEQPVSKPRK